MARAYSELSTCRTLGMGIGPIPWTSMLEWCEWRGLSTQATNHLISVLRHVDAETLRRERAKNAATK